MAIHTSFIDSRSVICAYLHVTAAAAADAPILDVRVAIVAAATAAATAAVTIRGIHLHWDKRYVEANRRLVLILLDEATDPCHRAVGSSARRNPGCI